MQLPHQLGLWRLGEPVHRNDTFHVSLAQPVDAEGSRRWDYVVKLGLGRDGQFGIHQSIAAGAAISHPNVVTILDGDPIASLPFIVMPRLDGNTLETRLKEPGMPLPVLLWIVRQLCQALESLHTRGWVHRDVKPANLMVGGNGHVTLIDLAFASGETSPDDGAFRGTPKYAAPELLGSSATAATDVFAAGRLLWEGLTCVETKNERALSAVCELVELMVDDDPLRRPTAHQLKETLLRMEIDTLSEHVGPATRRHAA